MTRSSQGSLEEVLGRSRVALRRQPEVDRGTRRIHRTIEIDPLARDGNVCFVHSPGTVGRFQFTAASLVELRRVPLYPAPNRRVISRQTALRHEFFDVAIGERILQIPPDSAKNDGWFEVPEWNKITYQYPGGVTLLCGQDYKMGTTFEGEKGTLNGIKPGSHVLKLRVVAVDHKTELDASDEVSFIVKK